MIMKTQVKYSSAFPLSVRIIAKLAVWWPIGWCYVSMSALSGVWWVTNSLQVRPSTLQRDWWFHGSSLEGGVPVSTSTCSWLVLCSIPWIVFHVSRAQWTTNYVFVSFVMEFVYFMRTELMFLLFSQNLARACPRGEDWLNPITTCLSSPLMFGTRRYASLPLLTSTNITYDRVVSSDQSSCTYVSVRRLKLV